MLKVPSIFPFDDLSLPISTLSDYGGEVSVKSNNLSAHGTHIGPERGIRRREADRLEDDRVQFGEVVREQRQMGIECVDRVRIALPCSREMHMDVEAELAVRLRVVPALGLLIAPI